ncbi:PQQ-binding-like beta-propeller repeat protein [Zavarzinella formosa]|uniref:PQQ-binding-like beta-propeller repeat protein n=1 Tax=Zavarzinella formosa TaxID=360055 RepID=UPI000315BBE2|nr:PQQ-binding-like beta-propeller repeat protein [Zavarzinella formosa]
MQTFLSAFSCVLLLAATVQAGDWPGWRGPTGQGTSDEKDLPLTWKGSAGENIAWKTRLPGQEGKNKQDENQSSPIVVKGKVIVTVSFWPGDADRAKTQPEHHVACYNAADGKQLWDEKIPPGPWKLTDLRGGYTAPTPASDSERIYVAFGSSVLAALDMDGKTVWRKEIVPYDFDVAFAASPVLYGETVILQCDGVKGSSRLLGFDRKTGDLKWDQKRPKNNFSHSTPVIAKIKDKDQLLIAASDVLQGADPTNGQILWWCSAKGDTVSPVLGGGVVYVDSGRGGPGYAVDPTGSGDVTKTHLKWKAGTVPDGFSSPVIVGDYLYRLHNPAILKCWKLDTGEAVFSERLDGITTGSSPVATADGRIYLASGGRSYVIKAGPKLDVLAVNELGDNGPASPAVSDGRLFIKGRQFLYGIGKK